MSFLQFAFYFFAMILIGAAARVVTVRNPVKAALYLVLAFFSAACIWITLEAEFLAIVLVLVYVGAVMVLFLFVVMMLDIDVARLREGFARYLPVGAVVAVVMVIELGVVLTSIRHPCRDLPVTVRIIPIPGKWDCCCIPIMSTHLNWPLSCCWWRSSQPLSLPFADVQRRCTSHRVDRFG